MGLNALVCTVQDRQRTAMGCRRRLHHCSSYLLGYTVAHLPAGHTLGLASTAGQPAWTPWQSPGHNLQPQGPQVFPQGVPTMGHPCPLAC